ncbi:MAG TPA: hypothetical protein PLX06_02035 [Fimbriimonadaceae bacterium]|nr:hypothetical protein [Fimbriimonadaceae bacterium]
MTVTQTALAAIAIVVAASAGGQGAKGKTPPPTQTKPIVGTAQMPGDNGKVGTPYQLGKTGDELIFTLEKAEFASRLLLSDNDKFPKAGERLLVVTYSVQNPGKSDRFFFNQSFSFTVVSPDDQNFVYDGARGSGAAAYHPDRKEPMSIQLKPAQKVKAIAVISMHPRGPVNKLIVQRHKDTPVLRYDMKEKVSPMTGAFAGKDGLEILDVGSAIIETPFDLGGWDVNVEKVSEELLPIGSYAPPAGQKCVILTVHIKNVGFRPGPMHSSLILPKMTDEDGSELTYPNAMLKNSAPESFNNGAIGSGEEARFRMVFYAPLLTKPAKVVFKEYWSGQSVAVKLEKPKDK